MPCATECPAGSDGLAGGAGVVATGAVGFVAAFRIFFAFVFELRAMGFQSSSNQRVVGEHVALRVLMCGRNRVVSRVCRPG